MQIQGPVPTPFRGKKKVFCAACGRVIYCRVPVPSPHDGSVTLCGQRVGRKKTAPGIPRWPECGTESSLMRWPGYIFLFTRSLHAIRPRGSRPRRPCLRHCPVRSRERGSLLQVIHGRRPLKNYFEIPRCRRASNNATPAATETLRLSTPPAMGIWARKSHSALERRRRPEPSAPSTSASGPFKSS